MADVFVYADETGNLDLSGGAGASRCFGIGTATWVGDHGRQLWEGVQLRFELEAAGVRQAKGFHAKNNSGRTRAQVFHLVKRQSPRFDTTFLGKSLAYPSVIAKGQLYFFQLAWLLHFRQIALQVSDPGDRLFVIVATLHTNARKLAVAEALTDVLAQTGARAGEDPVRVGQRDIMGATGGGLRTVGRAAEARVQ